MAFSKSLGKVGIGLLISIAATAQVTPFSPIANEIQVLQKNKYGFRSFDRVRQVKGDIFYNEKKISSKKAIQLFQQMYQAQFSKQEVSCHAGTLQAKLTGSRIKNLSGCLVGKDEKRFIASLQEIRFLALKKEEN